MNRRLYLIAAVSLVVIAGVALVVASGTNPSDLSGEKVVTSADQLPILAKAVPSLDAGKGWLNSPPLSDADLAGKVVLYDFWTYSCVNCVRTLPHLEAWYDRYKDDGLVIVGVHSPEFEFEKVHDNIAAASKKLHVQYPVVFDDDMAIWSSFNNQYWPAKYLADRQGQLRYVHYGEGAYAEAESAIRALLGVAKDSPKASLDAPDDETSTSHQTPETYLGSARGRIASPQGLDNGTRTFTAPDELGNDQVALTGSWLVTPEYVQATGDTQQIVLRYQGGEVNLVMDLVHDPIDLLVELDGDPVPSSVRGPSVEEVDGRTITHVTAADLYGLIAHGPAGDHVLTLTPLGAGLQAYAFTFGP